MALRGGKIASVADDGNPSKIQPSEIDIFTEPAVPAEKDVWLEVTGASPDISMTLKVFRFGAWRVLVSVSGLSD